VSFLNDLTGYNLINDTVNVLDRRLKKAGYNPKQRQQAANMVKEKILQREGVLNPENANPIDIDEAAKMNIRARTAEIPDAPKQTGNVYETTADSPKIDLKQSAEDINQIKSLILQKDAAGVQGGKYEIIGGLVGKDVNPVKNRNTLLSAINAYEKGIATAEQKSVIEEQIKSKQEYDQLIEKEAAYQQKIHPSPKRHLICFCLVSQIKLLTKNLYIMTEKF